MKKIQISLLTFLVFFSSNILCGELESNPTLARIDQLLKLTDREIKTINFNNYRSVELTHRLFELYTEKIRLFRERENEIMLKTESEIVLKKGKASFYTQSNDQFIFTTNFGNKLIKDNPKYERLAEVYYTQAMNSRDYGTNKDTESLLKLAISKSKSGSKTEYNSKVSLAEYYYNEKKYHDAVINYNDVLENKESEWYTKHLYNAAWCLLKERQFERALQLMKESFSRGENKKYISMKEQILSAIGIFFVQADRTRDAIFFFERNTSPSFNHLLNLAQSSMSKNQFSETDEVLRAALKDTQNRKDIVSEMKVRLAQLDIYRESKKDDHFYTTSNSIVELYKSDKKHKKIPSTDILQSINKIKDIAGFLQINLAKNKNKNEVMYEKTDYKRVIKYFDMLSVLDSSNKHQYRYYQGETSISVKNLNQAIKYYVMTIMSYKKSKSKDEFANKSIDAILTIIDDTELTQKSRDNYLIYTYKNYLILNPKADKSQAIYQKLFSKYFELKKIKKATNLLLVYKENYPNDEKIHREMLTQILENYIKRKQTGPLAQWVTAIEKGYLNFKNEYIENSIMILGNLLFERYQQLEKNGKTKEAIIGYEEIFESKKYPKKIKAQASYALSTVLLDLNDAKKSKEWLLTSIALFETKDLKEITNSLFVMAKNYRLLQEFEMTIQVSKLVLERFCKEKIENKNSFFTLLFETNTLIDLNSSSLSKITEENIKCDISEKTIAENHTFAIHKMILTDDLNNLKSFVNSAHLTSDSKKMISDYVRFKFYQSPKLFLNDLLAFDSKLPELDLSKSVTNYNKAEYFIEKINSIKIEFSALEKFDAKIYNQELEQYLSIINEITNEASRLSKELGAEDTIYIYQSVNRPYEELNKAILSYIPKGVDSKYLQGFNAGMRQISESLKSKSLQIDREKTLFLEKNNYFFEIQKHATFVKKEVEKNNNLLLNHQAVFFVNTIDRAKNSKSLAQGN